MDVKGIIYKILCVPNNKIYIGQTRTHYRRKDSYYLTSATYRWKNHLKESENINRKKQCRLLNHAIRKYGKNQFKITTIQECDLSQLDDLECYYIKKYNSLAPDGYNLTSGGRVYQNISDNLRIRLSQSGKKYFEKEGTKEKQSSLISRYYYHNIIKQYSQLEINKIEIRPINENDEFKLIYLYVSTSNNSNRIRIGGKHMNFSDTLKKSKEIALVLLNNDEDKLIISDLITNPDDPLSIYSKKINTFRDMSITRIQLTVHQHTHNKVITALVSTTKTKNWKDKIKVVFGGKKIPTVKAYETAISFCKRLEFGYEKIEIADSLNNFLAKSPNCG